MGELVVAIDIGTSKICALCGRLNKAGHLDVLTKSVVPCGGVKKGTIVDIETVADAITDAVRQIETTAGIKVGSAYINVMGLHTQVFTNRSMIVNTNPDREIQKKDVERLMFEIGNVDVQEDTEIIDVIPRQYIIDGYGGISEPIGMIGVNLELEADIVIGKRTAIANIVRCIEFAGIKIDGLVISSQALSEVVLTPEEMEMGVILIDIGGSITDVSVFRNGKLVFYESILVGGDHISNDISIGMKVSYNEADKIKREYELCLESLINKDQLLTVNDINDNSKKNVNISDVIRIIEARVFEIFTLCKKLLDDSHLNYDFGPGIVLTGGGIVYFDGNKQLANEVFGLPIKVHPMRIYGSQKVETLLAEGIVKHVCRTGKGTKYSSQVTIVKSREINAEGSFLHRFIALLKRIF